MELFLDHDSGDGLAAQLYAQLRRAILEGRLDRGDRLPPSRLLARDLGISRFTVTDVYARLAAEGYVHGQTSNGTTVTMRPPEPQATSPVSAIGPSPRVAAMRRYGTEMVRRPTFDMRPGLVDPSLFPSQAWRRCMMNALGDPTGEYGDPAGLLALRDTLARWIGRSRGVTTTATQVVVTSGAQHAFDLILRVLLEPGEVVAVEEPGYPPFAELCHSSGLEVVGVPVDDEGLVVDAVPDDARLVYVTPSHQFPTGVVMSYRRRIDLLRRARSLGAAIIEDDYDSQFRYHSRPLEPLQRLDPDGRVIYVATFSKILAPSMRLGFAVAPPAIVDAMTTLRQCVDWCPPATAQRGLASFIDDGHLARHLRRAGRAYRERRRLLIPAVIAGLTTPCVVPRSLAGLHLVVRFDDDIGAAALAAAAADHGVGLGSLEPTYRFGPAPGGVLLGFGGLPTERIPDAVAALDATLTDAIRSA